MKFRRIFGSSTEYSSLGVTRQMDATLYPHSLVSAADDQETPTLAIMSGPDEDTPQIKGLRESFLDESTQKLVARLTEARRCGVIFQFSAPCNLCPAARPLHIL